jgi:hypothetical protein
MFETLPNLTPAMLSRMVKGVKTDSNGETL